MVQAFEPFYLTFSFYFFFLIQTSWNEKQTKNTNIFYVFQQICENIYLYLWMMIFWSDFSCKQPMTFDMIHYNFRPYLFVHFIDNVPISMLNFHFLFLNIVYIALWRNPNCQYCARETPPKFPKHAHILFRSTQKPPQHRQYKYKT